MGPPRALHAIPQELIDTLYFLLPPTSKAGVTGLGTDIGALVMGLRTGLLIDCVSLQSAQADSLAHGLRKLGPGYDTIVVVHEPESSQTLVINRTLLESRMQDERDPFFLGVSGRLPTLADTPPFLRPLLNSIISYPLNAPFLSLSLPTSHSPPEVLIPFSGYILEYPIVYCVDDSGKNCLGGRELVVVKAILRRSDDSYTLMAFSYPEGLEGLPPGKLICDKLEETLRKRLEAAAQAEKWETVTVEYESGIVMDRFSL